MSTLHSSSQPAVLAHPSKLFAVNTNSIQISRKDEVLLSDTTYMNVLQGSNNLGQKSYSTSIENLSICVFINSCPSS
uniref:Uncharacterized protein n=1 Tax=Rhizophora mucronata TaxID=61149 RepID=A0A2P2PPY0_RHIMU